LTFPKCPQLIATTVGFFRSLCVAVTDISGMICFSYLTDFSYSPPGKNFKSCRAWSELVKNGGLEMGCRWFQLFSIILFANQIHP
jgi:hypothetical protein